MYRGPENNWGWTIDIGAPAPTQVDGDLNLSWREIAGMFVILCVVLFGFISAFAWLPEVLSYLGRTLGISWVVFGGLIAMVALGEVFYRLREVVRTIWYPVIEYALGIALGVKGLSALAGQIRPVFVASLLAVLAAVRIMIDARKRLVEFIRPAPDVTPGPAPIVAAGTS